MKPRTQDVGPIVKAVLRAGMPHETTMRMLETTGLSRAQIAADIAEARRWEEARGSVEDASAYVP